MKTQKIIVTDPENGACKKGMLYKFNNADDFMCNAHRFIDRGVHIKMNEANSAVTLQLENDDPIFFKFSEGYLLEYKLEDYKNEFYYLFVKQSPIGIKAEINVSTSRLVNDNGEIKRQEYTGPVNISFNFFDEMTGNNFSDY